MTTRIIGNGLFLGALMGLVSVSYAASEAQEQVEYREGVFHVMAWDFSQMKRMLEDQNRYSQTEFLRRARRLASMTKMLPEGFPDTQQKRVKTDAKKEIWQNWQDFQQHLTKIETNSEALAQAAVSENKAEIIAAFKKVGDTCKGCHDDYRQD